MDSSSGIGNFPLALSLAYKFEDEVQNKFDGLTESEKEEVLNRCKDAKSAEEVKDIITNI